MSSVRARLYQFMTGSPVAALVARNPRLKSAALHGAVARARVSHRLEGLRRDLADRLGLVTRRDLTEVQRRLRAVERDLEPLDGAGPREGR